jgi:hypothetical protein
MKTKIYIEVVNVVKHEDCDEITISVPKGKTTTVMKAISKALAFQRKVDRILNGSKK